MLTLPIDAAKLRPNLTVMKTTQRFCFVLSALLSAALVPAALLPAALLLAASPRTVVDHSGFASLQL